MSSTLSPNMSLIIPTVGSELGPTYAFDINASLTLVDQHSHLPGAGVPIVPAAMNINTDLTFATNAATNLKYVGFYTQGSSPGISGGLYVKLGSEGTPRPDLWYNDGVTDVQITSAGNVNATAASIPGQSYAGGTFTWKQGAGSTTPANFDIGSITIRPNTAATTNGVTITPPSGIGSAFTLALPTIPASTSFLTIDNSGNIVSTTALLGVLDHTNLSASAAITGSQLSASAGIVGTQLAAATITTTQIAAGTIVDSNIAAGTITGAKIGSATIGSGNLGSDLALTGYTTLSSLTPMTGPTLIASRFFRTVMLSVRSGSLVAGTSQGITSYNSGNGVVTYSSAYATTPVVIATCFSSSGTASPVFVAASSTSTCTLVDNAAAAPQDFDLIAIGLHS